VDRVRNRGQSEIGVVDVSDSIVASAFNGTRTSSVSRAAVTGT